MVDVLVCGAGPAGSALAWRLARAGLHVAIADAGRHPRRKPCGESLNPGAAAAVLRLAGVKSDGRSDGSDGRSPSDPRLGAFLREQTQTLEGWVLHSGGVALEARYPGGWSGWACRREVLDEWLLQGAIAAGAELLADCRILSVRELADGCEATAVREGVQAKLLATYVAGADGLRSAVARSAGLQAAPGPLRKVALTARISGLHGLRALVELHLERGSVIGIAPLQGGAANATLALSSAEAARLAPSLRRRPEALIRSLLQSPKLGERAADAMLESEVLACGPFDFPVRQAHSGRVLLVGDAAGYYDPLTGQGIYRALRGAELAAQRLLLAAVEGPPALQGYSEQLRKEFAAGSMLQRWIEYGAARPALFRTALCGLKLTGSAQRLAALVGDCRFRTN